LETFEYISSRYGLPLLFKIEQSLNDVLKNVCDSSLLVSGIDPVSIKVLSALAWPISFAREYWVRMLLFQGKNATSDRSFYLMVTQDKEVGQNQDVIVLNGTEMYHIFQYNPYIKAMACPRDCRWNSSLYYIPITGYGFDRYKPFLKTVRFH
jgi:hypothetical protein